jgi:hypothetical protein
METNGQGRVLGLETGTIKGRGSRRCPHRARIVTVRSHLCLFSRGTE